MDAVDIDTIDDEDVLKQMVRQHFFNFQLKSIGKNETEQIPV